MRTPARQRARTYRPAKVIRFMSCYFTSIKQIRIKRGILKVSQVPGHQDQSGGRQDGCRPPCRKGCFQRRPGIASRSDCICSERTKLRCSVDTHETACRVKAHEADAHCWFPMGAVLPYDRLEEVGRPVEDEKTAPRARVSWPVRQSLGTWTVP